jgi:hypothetical protein
LARGWESKSVEAQQADRDRPVPRVIPASDVLSEIAARRGVEMARARIAADLVVATRPAHRAMLEAALKSLDDQLK